MSPDMSQLLLATAPAVIASWATYRFGLRQGRDERRRLLRDEAATELAPRLRTFQSLVRRYGRTELTAQEVSDAFQEWAEVYDRQRTRLPDAWRHLGRSVRAAVSTVFGASAYVDLRPDTEAYPLADPDALWQDLADEYLGYIHDAIKRWADSDTGTPKAVANFDQWLKWTEQPVPLGRFLRT